MAKNRYKVLVGKHIEGKDAQGKSCVYGQGEPLGDVVATEKDLLSLNGLGGMQPKFQLLGPATDEPDAAAVMKAVSSTDDPLTDMTDEQLEAAAADSEIDISDCGSREEVIAKIRAART